MFRIFRRNGQRNSQRAENGDLREKKREGKESRKVREAEEGSDWMEGGKKEGRSEDEGSRERIAEICYCVVGPRERRRKMRHLDEEERECDRPRRRRTKRGR